MSTRYPKGETKGGKIIFLEHESRVLKGNALGDPYRRRFPVYLPPGYEKSTNKRYPVIFGLIGFTGSGVMYLNKSFSQQSYDDILDELIVKKGMPGVIYVMPDCMTYLGGCQYVNSSAVGRYEDYLVKELVPFIDRELRTTGRRGCVGGSSGGIGSFHLAVRHPEVFQAFGNHSGDSGFESSFLAEVPQFVQAMKKYDYKLERFFKDVPTALPKDEKYMTLLMITAMSACYSPNPKAKLGFDCPIDPYTGEVDRRIWDRWLEFDPIHMVEPYRKNLKKLKACWVDCGVRDQHHLYLGARQLHERLKAAGIRHVYAEYEGNHGVLRREQKKKSIPFIVRALGGR